MKRAFTLIELLVVIAIIAILAAILFPVFAQAKLAAKKTVSLSNQKQIGLSLLMYSGDWDDTYPRNDGCTLNDSMLPEFNNVPAGTDPTPWCNGTGSGGVGDYAFRDNHYNWQKWVYPYVKSTQMFIHPAIALLKGTSFVNGAYKNQGEISSGYALNIAITGSLNTWGYAGPPYTNPGAIRDSFVGGTQTGVPSPADAMIVVEQPFQSVTGAITYPYNTPAGQEARSTYYPIAVREHWQAIFYKLGGTGPCNTTTELDTKASPFMNQVPLSYADGHSKVISVGQFLANTPTAAQYGFSSFTPFCTVTASYNNSGNVKPTWTQPWPMWGLQ